jgi:hypothetical protein
VFNESKAIKLNIYKERGNRKNMLNPRQYLSGFPTRLRPILRETVERDLTQLVSEGIEKEFAEEFLGTILDEMRPLCKKVGYMGSYTGANLLFFYCALKELDCNKSPALHK